MGGLVAPRSARGEGAGLAAAPWFAWRHGLRRPAPVLSGRARSARAGEAKGYFGMI